MSFLLDTDTCSAYLKGDRRVWGRFMLHTGGLRLSTITVGELFTWTRRANASPKRLTKLHELLREVAVLPVDLAVAETFGGVRAALLDAGARCPEMDLMIAATALVHDLTVVTHNTADFQRRFPRRGIR